MYNGKSVLGVIPARAGSKGVVGKNVKLLGGKPLIVWTLEAARKTRHLDRILVSTDDPKVIAICEAAGCEYLNRPEELANDTAPMLPVLQHATAAVQAQGFKPDIVVLLQPTTPFKKPEQIDDCIELLDTRNTDSVMSVSRVPKHFSPYWQKRIDENGNLVPAIESGTIRDDKKYVRKQDLPDTYWKNGAVYAITYETLMSKNSLFGDSCAGYVIAEEEIVNIDTEAEFAYAEEILRRNHGRNS